MNLTGKQPMGAKLPRARKNPDYLAAVRSLRCCICEAWGMQQLSPTTAHHPIHGRYGTRKAPDMTAIPLCCGHHLGDFDTSKIALHREPSKWKRMYGPDTDWVAPTQDKLSQFFEGSKE